MTIDLSKYWKERYEAEEKRRAKSDEELERQLDAIYKQHIAEIQKEIDAFWQRYADKNGITKLEAKKQADNLDMDVVSYKAKQLVARAEKWRKEGRKVTQKDFTKAENDLMKLYNLKMKTSRLEVLQANLKLHQYELAMNELEATERHLIEAVRQENLYSSGILKDTLGSYQTSKTSAETIAYANFHGSNWSTKIWERQHILREVVRKSVADTILRGKGTQLLIKQLEKEFKVSYGYARRLAVTETARVYSEAQKANYKANDFEYYEILAESGACNICKPYDSKHYKVDDMAPGHNAPPFHPNCKCTTVPYVDRTASYSEFKEDVSNAFDFLGKKPNATKKEIQKLFKNSYNVGKLFEHKIFGEYSGKNVVIPDHMIAYALTAHQNQIVLDEFLKIKEVVKNPDFISEDIRGHKNTFLLNKKISDNRFLEAGIEDKGGQFVFHFMLRGEKKNNKRLRKIIDKVKKYDIVNQKVYNIGEE
ncbi:minor capsid protein [Streptococcus hillyeri]|uniref:Phage head morphogenesis domain-containing protein n=1 Tax=Streptococcus hillyeri TaxID=2282420 RepID=A0A3L9DNT6_9STRE|nr:minor capsid protein [Streptococcus hillyeri]RLY03086.1 hypothetical protein EAF07_05975 [Streptococcus hillyeri]